MHASYKCIIIYLIAFIPTFSHGTFNPQKLIEQTYCTILGDKDASPHYQATTREALHNFGVKDVDNVPIKKMNTIPQHIMGNKLYSFTMFGIWFNEDLLNKCDEAEQLFMIHHEAAHYANKHHPKVLLSLLPIPLLLLLIKKVVPSSSSTVISARGIAAGALIMLTALGMPALIKTQEKEADLEAARILCNNNQQEILQEYINTLQEHINDGSGNSTDGWHKTVAEQYQYLTDYVNAKTKS